MKPIDWAAVIGSDPLSFCDELYAQKPSWASGSISHFDARFLFRCALGAGAAVGVEIGTASGFSTVFLCHAMNFASKVDLAPQDFRLISYDRDPYFYVDPSRLVGDATREVLSEPLLDHVSFRNPATAIELRAEHEPDTIELLFIDANHKNPWPTLDLLASLDSLRPGATVLLHDINLPVRLPEFADWGAKHLFDDLDVEKEADPGDDVPNIGRIVVPDDKETLREQLLQILFRHQWEHDIPEDVTTLALR